MSVRINLDGRQFNPVRNSKGRRVTSDAIFTFSQSGDEFVATYAGDGFSDGHLIGRMYASGGGHLVYHCRAGDGALEVGEAEAVFSRDESDRIVINMDWRWLNGTNTSGQSTYVERRD